MAAVFDLKIVQYLVEALVETDGDAIVTQMLIEYLWDVTNDKRDARVSQMIIEYLLDIPHRDARVSQMIIEVAFKGSARKVYLDEAGNCELSW